MDRYPILGNNDCHNSNSTKVIFVNRFYWPDVSATSQILTDLAEFLAGAGTEVTIITSRRSYHDPKAILIDREIKNRVRVRRIATTSFGNSRIIGKSIDFVTFYISASIMLFLLARRGDTVVTKTDPPLIGLCVWAIGRIRGANVINWCQDLFPEIAGALGVTWARGLTGSLLQEIRNHTLQRSQVNVVVSETMKDTLVAQGIDSAKVVVIRNWPDQNIRPIEPFESRLRTEWGLDRSFVLAYSGNLGRAHATERVYKLVQLLEDVVDLKLLFIGAGHGMKWLERKCAESRYHHVLFMPHQPRERLSDSLSVPDMHIVSLNERCQRYLFPSKYYGILAAARPVLFLGDSNSEMAREVEIGRIGVSLDSASEHAWREQILSLKEQPETLREMRHRARLVYENRYVDAFSLSLWKNALSLEEAHLESRQQKRLEGMDTTSSVTARNDASRRPNSPLITSSRRTS